MKKLLYKKIKRAERWLSDSSYRNNLKNLSADFRQTKANCSNWASAAIPGKGDSYFAVISFSNLPFFVKFHAIVAKAMELRGYKSLIITVSGNKYALKVFRLFATDQVILWDKFSMEHEGLKVQIPGLIESLLPVPLNIDSGIRINFKGVDIGKHALSMTCRKRIEGRLNLEDPQTKEMFLHYLKEALFSALVAEKLFDKYPIAKQLIRDSGYIPNGAIFEVGLERGVDSVVVEFGQKKSSWIFKRHRQDTKNRHYFSLSKSTWESLKNEPLSPRMLEAVNKEIEGRYSPVSDEDTRRLQSGKEIKSKEEVQTQLGLNPNKKTAVIFSHVAWDATFFYGKCLFTDYEDWLYQTVDFVNRELPELNWIVKVHPYNAFKLQRETIKTTSEERLLADLMPFNDHVVMMMPDTDINSQSLFSVIDYALTVNGSVGFEYPMFGIRAILAGTGRYEGFGFTVEPKTKEEYFQQLRDILNIPPLTEEQIALAKKHYYYAVIGKQVMFDDVAPMTLLKLHEADSSVHNNISINANSLDNFASKKSIQHWSNWMANETTPDILNEL
jgi:hypothetical protein